jgi:predicted dienelactone hydrolase
MKLNWIRRIALALVLLACGLGGYVYWTALRSERPVGFQLVQGAGPDGRPLLVGVWYPAAARAWPTLAGLVLMNVARDAPVDGHKLPLVAISHGNGGGPAGHADLALALAGAGYIVAAPMHNGDNLADQSALASASFFSARTGQLHAALDFMLEDWSGRDRIDPARIGAFGFSMGGFTVLTAVGAQPDLARISSHCAASQEFVCSVLRQAGSPSLKAGFEPLGSTIWRDPRIRAAVVAAPGLGFTMEEGGHANVGVPIQLWSGDQDRLVPYASNAGLLRKALGPKVQFHSVPGAGHASFLAPCSVLAPAIPLCADAGQFDRKAFHKKMNATVLAFFQENLTPR